MSPSHRVRVAVSCFVALLSTVCAGPVVAQLFEDPRIAFDLSPDPLARSPRLVGLGRLSLVVDDPHNRITLWDFGGNPAGLFDADSVSTLELRPGTGAASAIHDLAGSGLVRQERAGRSLHFGYEAWRHQGQTVYGAIGDIVLDRSDLAYDDYLGLQSRSSRPSAMPIVSGVMPYTKSGRLRYAVRLISSTQSINDQYGLMPWNTTGQYVDGVGEEVDPPNPFMPDETHASVLGAGFATSYRFGRRLTAAVGVDATRSKIRGENSAPLYEAQVQENRPYKVGQVTIVGRLGRGLEWGVDGRGWKSSSQQNWAFSVSQGPGATPLTGRGKLLEREEEGSVMRTRARWLFGSVEVGAGFNTGYRKIARVPADTTDPTSFNYFLNSAYGLVLSGSGFPDSVTAGQSMEWLWEAGGGLAWHLPGRGGVMGVEYHRSRKIEHRDVGRVVEVEYDHWRRIERRESSVDGPKRIAWDVRGGLEYPCTKVLTGRVGYQYFWEDRDDFTLENEYRGHGLTMGAGVHPAGAIWAFESGYAIRWEQADFGHPGRPRGSRQQLTAQARWSF